MFDSPSFSLLPASGHCSSFIDMAPTYAGIIYSLSNTLNSVIGFLAPQLSGLLLVDNVRYL